MTNFNSHRSSGFSLLELILVLTIISAIIIGAFIIYPRVRDAAQSREESQMVKRLVDEIRRLYPTGNYGPLLASDLVGSSALPPDSFIAPTDPGNSSGGILSNRWGASIDVYPVLSDGTPVVPGPLVTAEFFAVRYWGATPDLCRGMAAQLVEGQGALLLDDGALGAGMHVAKNAYLDVDYDATAVANGCILTDNVRPRLVLVSD